MGLGSTINDVSSADSLPLLLIAIIANCICYTRSMVFWVCKSFGYDVEFSFTDYDFDHHHEHDLVVLHASDNHSLLNAVGLSGVNSAATAATAASSDDDLILKEQLLLNLNHQVYYYEDHHQEEEGDDDRLQCIVCLCRLRDGEHVRQLGCKHIFHKGCLDGWLIDHFNSTCPLCRSPLVLDSHQHHHHHLLHRQPIIPAF